MSHAVIFLLFPGVQSLDAVGPYEVLARLPGTQLAFVGEEKRIYRTDTGSLGLQADETFASLPQPDIVVVPGGPMAWNPEAHGALVQWLTAAHPKTTWTTSVCTGALLMAAAGLLTDRPATTHWAAHDTLRGMGPDLWISVLLFSKMSTS